MVADRRRFPDALLSLLQLSSFSGREIIATSRAILRNDYSDDEYYEEFFSIFILIDQETGHIVLNGFGEYNISTERFSIGDSWVLNFVRAIKSKILRNRDTYYNEPLYLSEIEEIEELYSEDFQKSIREFILYFGLR